MYYSKFGNLSLVIVDFSHISSVCRLMELPLPEADEIGRPSWNVTSGDISKAYRRLSVLVHPDKNPGEDARKAFEALNDTYRKLRDPSQLVSMLAIFDLRIRLTVVVI
jgi:hypothetical protein